MRSAAVILVLTLTACAPNDRDTRDTASKAYLQALASKDTIDALEKRIKVLEDDQPSPAVLKLSDDGKYAEVGTTLGTLTVALVNVKPLAAGSALRLQIGNPTSAKITRYSIYGTYGTKEGDGSEQSYAFDSGSAIEQGSWHEVTIPLNDLPPTKIGYITVRNILVSNITLDIS